MALKTVISLKDNYTAVLRTVNKETRKFNREINSVKKEIIETNKKELKVKITSNTRKINKEIKAFKKDLNKLNKTVVTKIKTVANKNKYLNQLKNKLIHNNLLNNLVL